MCGVLLFDRQARVWWKRNWVVQEVVRYQQGDRKKRKTVLY